MAEPFTILVNGGGIAGLAVAQAFRKINNPVIKVIVFEKLAVEPSFQLYPIHLSPSGRTSLISLLSPTAFSSLVARSSPRGITHAGILISDTKLRRLFGLEKWEEEYPIFVLRWVLKEVLGEGVEERRGKRSVGVEENELRGKVRLLFDDGTVEEGDLLVGAEGISSITRSYLLPSLPLKSRSLPYLTINFKLRSPSLLTPLLPSQNGLNMLLGTTSYSLILVCITGEDAQNATEMAREDSGFTYGIMTVPFFEGWKEMGEEGWKEICLEYLRSDEADGAIGKALVEEWVKGTGGCWEVVSALGEDRNWTSERCVLVGDACHLMPPFGGVGAASGLTDAVDLAHAVSSSSRFTPSGPSLASALATFRTSMLKRTTALSEDAERRLLLSQKNGWGVTLRWALMRVMDRCLPLALWVLSRKREAAGSSG